MRPMETLESMTTPEGLSMVPHVLIGGLGIGFTLRAGQNLFDDAAADIGQPAEPIRVPFPISERLRQLAGLHVVVAMLLQPGHSALCIDFEHDLFAQRLVAAHPAEGVPFDVAQLL